ncbi:hypothetical protein IGI72_003818 [Enterococcus sp. DIV1059_2]
MDSNILCGLVHLYDSETDTTSVSWSYRDNPELKFFVLEYYDSDKRKWLPYDGHMGIIEKDSY